MDYFRYRRGVLHCEDVPVPEIAARAGTPSYIYSARTVVEHYRKLRDAFRRGGLDVLVCYSVKANGNLSLLKLMQHEGSGFDVVSGGEIHRALRAGADPRTIVYAGVGKTETEIRLGLERDILQFNIESEDEVEAIDGVARSLGRQARIAIRVNPDVDPKTHTYITTGKKENKFGLDMDRTRELFGRLGRYPGVRLAGLHMHIGSQIVQVEPYVDALKRLLAFLPECAKAGHRVETLDLGGGFGIFYREKSARPPEDFANALLPLLAQTGCRLILEPGRFIVGNAGILVTRVLYVKRSGEKTFYICDGGMTDLIRPSLYGAYHRIWPVETDAAVEGDVPDEETWAGAAAPADVVGPICESGDFFAKDRRLPPLEKGRLLAVFSAGAYGYAMSSNYNSRPRPAETLVAGGRHEVVNPRETVDDLLGRVRVVLMAP
jgi:diaminopimelate decarboxylase